MQKSFDLLISFTRWSNYQILLTIHSLLFVEESASTRKSILEKISGLLYSYVIVHGKHAQKAHWCLLDLFTGSVSWYYVREAGYYTFSGIVWWCKSSITIIRVWEGRWAMAGVFWFVLPQPRETAIVRRVTSSLSRYNILCIITSACIMLLMMRLALLSAVARES